MTLCLYPGGHIQEGTHGDIVFVGYACDEGQDGCCAAVGVCLTSQCGGKQVSQCGTRTHTHLDMRIGGVSRSQQTTQSKPACMNEWIHSFAEEPPFWQAGAPTCEAANGGTAHVRAPHMLG